MAFSIVCSYQNYDWGKFGIKSEVLSLLLFSKTWVNLDIEKPYAELWMGTHSSGPSRLGNNQMSLFSYIQNNPHVLGDKIRQQFGHNLPFLFKVLSIGKALSIQAHPNKKDAEILNRDRPDLYKDDNHKPEMAIALTEFEALCGFRDSKDLLRLFQDLPELTELIGHNEIEVSTKRSFEALMRCADTPNMTACIDKIVARFKSQPPHNSLPTHPELVPLFLQLNHDYPNDVGSLCMFFLNRVVLQPGQALFLKANLPHAYLSGDCIECMACSDNVVRLGLTPKHKDVATLLSLLDYSGYAVEDLLFSPTVDCGVQGAGCQRLVYDPPVDDFAVDCLRLRADGGHLKGWWIDVASILLVISGTGQMECRSGSTEPTTHSLGRGCVFFVCAESALSMQSSNADGEDLVVYRAYA